MLTFLIYKIHCTQIYCINLAHEQIHGKPKRNVFIVVIKMAFRFVQENLRNKKETKK